MMNTHSVAELPDSQSPIALPDSGHDYYDQQQQEQQQAQIQEHLKRVNSSLNVLSFGFLATAVLISVFLFVALFERFLHRHPRRGLVSTTPSSAPLDVPFVGQASQSSQDIGILLPEKSCLMGVSVLMPGQSVPTFIASPAPIVYETEDCSELEERQNASTQGGHQEV